MASSGLIFRPFGGSINFLKVNFLERYVGVEFWRVLNVVLRSLDFTL